MMTNGSEGGVPRLVAKDIREHYIKKRKLGTGQFGQWLKSPLSVIL